MTRQQSADAALAQGLVVVGASAGGVEALCGFVAGLPPDIEDAVLVVLHLAADSPSVLPQILARRTTLPVLRAADDERIRAGHIYVAAPGRHVLVRDGRLRLSDAPKENGHRPAVDPAFRTAARAFGPRVAGVLLSGTRDDGAAGLLHVKQAGGTAVVQDPEEALYDGMPRAALRHVDVDVVLPVADIGQWLAGRPARRVPVPVPEVAMMGEPPAEDPTKALDLSAGDPAAAVPGGAGNATRFTCPDCAGVLYLTEQSGLLRFNCSVGHAYSLDSLNAENLDRVEEALWTAARALEDRVVLLSQMAERARAAGHTGSAERFDLQGRDLVRRAASIRAAIDGFGGADAA